MLSGRGHLAYIWTEEALSVMFSDLRPACLSLAVLLLLVYSAGAEPLKPGGGTLTVGTITEWVSSYPGGPPVERPLAGATILIGTRLWLDVKPSGVDLVLGEPVLEMLTTDEYGTFASRLPPGKYDIIVWKRGYIPQTDPGSALTGYTQAIRFDDQARGLHQNLEFHTAKKPSGPAVTTTGKPPKASGDPAWTHCINCGDPLKGGEREVGESCGGPDAQLKTEVARSYTCGKCHHSITTHYRVYFCPFCGHYLDD